MHTLTVVLELALGHVAFIAALHWALYQGLLLCMLSCCHMLIQLLLVHKHFSALGTILHL